jgi:hypothetical protein
MHPKNMPVCDRLPQFGIISAKPRRKSGQPIASPPHPYEVVWTRDGEADREQNVI